MALARLTPAVCAFLEEPRYAVIATIHESGMLTRRPGPGSGR